MNNFCYRRAALGVKLPSCEIIWIAYGGGLVGLTEDVVGVGKALKISKPPAEVLQVIEPTKIQSLNAKWNHPFYLLKILRF